MTTLFSRKQNSVPFHLQAQPYLGEADAAAAPVLLDNPEAEFQLGEPAGTVVDSVSTQSPVDDFEALIQQGQLDDAVEGLQKAVYTLVDTSLGDRYRDLLSKGVCCLGLLVLVLLSRKCMSAAELVPCTCKLSSCACVEAANQGCAT